MMLDPALVPNESNHHSSLYAETLATCREMAIPFRVLGSARGSSGLPVELVTPFFECDTYQTFSGMDEYRRAEAALQSTVALDFQRLMIEPGARLLLHSANPWQIQALAGRLRDRPDVRVAVGLMFPSRLWTPDLDLQVLLDEITWRSLDGFGSAPPFVYSETGVAHNGRRRIDLPTFPSLMSDATLRWCQDLVSGSKGPGTGPLTFGFFGGLFEHKGVRLVLEAARLLLRDGCETRVLFFVPSEFVSWLQRLEPAPPNVEFRPAPLEGHDYLKAMSEVTAVLCCYDCRFYRDQMSGIVTEAAALGRPVIVTQGTAVHRFLLRYAPGAAVVVGEDERELAEVLARPLGYWLSRERDAATSASLVRELKSCRRFLRVALGY